MSAQENVETVKKFFAALSGGGKQDLLALSAEDIEWIIPGEDWPLAGTYRGHAGLTDLLQRASRTVETSTEPHEFIAQGDRVLVIGFASGKMLATGKSFNDDWIFAVTVQDGKLKSIREYVDTQALADAAEKSTDSRSTAVSVVFNRPGRRRQFSSAGGRAALGATGASHQRNCENGAGDFSQVDSCQRPLHA